MINEVLKQLFTYTKVLEGNDLGIFQKQSDPSRGCASMTCNRRKDLQSFGKTYILGWYVQEEVLDKFLISTLEGQLLPCMKQYSL